MSCFLFCLASQSLSSQMGILGKAERICQGVGGGWSPQEALGTLFEEWGFQWSSGDGQIEEKDCLRNPEKLLTTWMEPEDIMQTSQSQKKRPHELTYLWNLKQSHFETESTTVAARGWGWVAKVERCWSTYKVSVVQNE